MKLTHGLHLAYCTNIHRGESWEEILRTLRTHTLAVRDRVGGGRPYAIGLRLGDVAARELAEPATLAAFQEWLARENCYVFTINGFPYGRFHGTRVKEQVYLPDWTTPEREDYTIRLFELIAVLAPAGVAGSVSTVPGSFKAFQRTGADLDEMCRRLWNVADHLERLSERTGRDLHLGLEPEPLCQLETTGETVEFFGRLQAQRPGDERWRRFLGVNYDTCHLAVEFEEPGIALARLHDAGLRLSKLHLSSALSAAPTPEARTALAGFTEDTYLHQVVTRDARGGLTRHLDLPVALADPVALAAAEWRIHFHVPLHAAPVPCFGHTTDHLLGVLDILARNPGWCEHLEMETYTWEVMPPGLKSRDVVEQLVAEYDWTLRELALRGIVPAL